MIFLIYYNQFHFHITSLHAKSLTLSLWDWGIISMKRYGNIAFLSAFRYLTCAHPLSETWCLSKFLPMYVLDHWSRYREVFVFFLPYECLIPHLLHCHFHATRNLVHRKVTNGHRYGFGLENYKKARQFCFLFHQSHLSDPALSQCPKIMILQISFQCISWTLKVCIGACQTLSCRMSALFLAFRIQFYLSQYHCSCKKGKRHHSGIGLQKVQMGIAFSFWLGCSWTIYWLNLRLPVAPRCTSPNFMPMFLSWTVTASYSAWQFYFCLMRVTIEYNWRMKSWSSILRECM